MKYKVTFEDCPRDSSNVIEACDEEDAAIAFIETCCDSETHHSILDDGGMKFIVTPVDGGEPVTVEVFGECNIHFYATAE